MWSTGSLGFAAKLAPDGTAVIWSTYLPNGSTLALGTAGDMWLAGLAGAGFLVTDSAPQPCFGTLQTPYLLHLDSSGSLVDATYGPAQSYTVQSLRASTPDSVVLITEDRLHTDSLVSQITFGSPNWLAPACLSPDVVNGATLVSTGVVAPGEFVTLTGLGIAPDTGMTYQPGPNGQVPTSLGGVTVLFDGIPAPLFYVQSRQINTQVPFAVTNSSTKVTVQYNNSTFGPVSMTVALGMPGIFRAQAGVSTQAIAQNQDGSVNSTANPVAAGSIVSFYATGLGPSNPSCTTGMLNYPAATGMFYPNAEINATSGGPVVKYEGSAPGMLCGIVQFNVQIPVGTPPGAFLLDPIFVTQSPVGSTVAVK